jgi:hypothetical protein
MIQKWEKKKDIFSKSDQLEYRPFQDFFQSFSPTYISESFTPFFVVGTKNVKGRLSMTRFPRVLRTGP